jgi:hypothetical protein
MLLFAHAPPFVLLQIEYVVAAVAKSVVVHSDVIRLVPLMIDTDDAEHVACLARSSWG